MNKTDIQTILQKPYQSSSWTEFLKDIFGGSYRNNPPAIELPNNEIAHTAYEIGQFTTTDNMLVGVYEVKIKEGVSIENKKVSLRNLLRSVYRVVDAALIVFDTGETWRFSYVSEIFVRDEAGNRKQFKTDPKRYTYVLGNGSGVRTATERFFELSKKGQQVKLKDLNDAFSVELLTKNFYRDLSDWYFWALTNVTFPDDAEPNDEVRNATSVIRLITRLIFVWFLKQKKLVRDELFDEAAIKEILKNFNTNNDQQSSAYYKAILQNLFFATLNTEMTDDKRKFINRQTGVQGFYRYERYFQNKERFLELTKETPFLNGGLFENLDRNIGEPNEIRIDCFSNRLSNENRLIVPDYLFFGEDTTDLSSVYDDKKRKAVQVKGVIHILKSYNFTVEENTPTDIEVALDPELLGKVFENLLASYNPETKTTARKQTGSFYTPREIVEYMVDESLKAYLKEALQNKTENNIEECLDDLFSYSNEYNPFNEQETLVLIGAIDRCKILDPACGSGAFPMGVLQRLVFLLRKLDPVNEYWREQQISRATKEFEQALRLGQSIDLQTQIQEITDTFTHNTDDFGRKLYLIENCIYGVDIQPIAVQIAKLRFFISLMAEQNSLQQGTNRGIRPLPNLETKFVAANTLIGLEKPSQLLLKNTTIDVLEKQLEEVRHKHFFARTPETKKKYRLKDQELRKEIAQLLSNDGWKPSSANQVAAWNPYDQSTFAPFFNAEWMFGIIDGFDIVIGNPPYVSANNMSYEDRNALNKSEEYQYLKGKWDLYVPFVEKSIKILSRNGFFVFIIPYGILNQPFAEELRKAILKDFKLLSIVDLKNNKIFENATVPSCIPIIQRKKSFNHEVSILGYSKSEFIKNYGINIQKYHNTEQNMFRTENLNKLSSILDRIKAKGNTLESNFYVSTGAEIHGKESKDDIGKTISGKSKFDVLHKIYSQGLKPYIEGSAIPKSKSGRYSFPKIDTWLDYSNPQLMRSAKFSELFESEKIILRASSGNLRILAIYDDRNIYTSHKSIIIIENSNLPQGHLLKKDISLLNLKYLLAILNCQLIDFYYGTVFGGFIDVYPNNLKSLPIPQISIAQQQPFIRLVEYILLLKKEDIKAQSTETIIKYFEDIIDGLVYELYFEEELHRAGIYFHKYLLALPDISDDSLSIADIFFELYSPNHPVRASLFKLDTVEEVAIIKR